MDHALSDVTVLDLGQVIAMPFCTMLLADLGARVIKVESRERGRERLSLGVKRQGNHIDNSKYLYYDGQLVISLDEFPKGKRIPPHDHGVWEALAVYQGSFDHTVYERLDDGSKEGFADLKTVDDRRLKPGDVAIVAQPAEIHTFVALEESTYSVTVVGGHYAEERHYFKPEDKTCVKRKPRVVT